MTRTTKVLVWLAASLAVSAVAGTLVVYAGLRSKAGRTDEQRIEAERQTEEQVSRFAQRVLGMGTAQPGQESLDAAARAGPVTLVTTVFEPELVATVEAESAFRVLFGVDRVNLCYRVRFEGLGTPDPGYSTSRVDC